MNIGDKRRDEFGVEWVLIGIGPIIGEALLLIQRVKPEADRPVTRNRTAVRARNQWQIRSRRWESWRDYRAWKEAA